MYTRNGRLPTKVSLHLPNMKTICVGAVDDILIRIYSIFVLP